MLVVEGLRRHQRDPTQRVFRRRELSVAKAQQAAQRTTADVLGAKGDQSTRCLEPDDQIPRLCKRTPDLQLARVLTYHERLPVGEEHIQRSIALEHAGRSDLLVDFDHQRVALVEKIVYRRSVAAGRGRFGNAAVETGDVARVGIDGYDRAFDPRVGTAARFCQLLAQLMEARHQRLRRTQERLARWHVGGTGRDGIDAGKKITERRAE